MGNNSKIDKNFEKVTKFNILLTVIENIIFFLVKKWDYTVLTGSLWGLVMTSVFFYMICVSVPRALAMEDPDIAAKRIRASQLERLGVLAVGIFAAIKISWINWPAALIPLLFTRISIVLLNFTDKEG